MSKSVTGGHRRHAVRITAVALLAMVLTACHGVWGLRGSYRSYVAGPAGSGEIETSGGAVWTDGEGPGKGPFTWMLVSATYDEATATGEVQLKGTVETRAHQNDQGIWLLDTTVSNPRLVIDGDDGTLYADINFRPFQGTMPEPIPNRQAVVDVPFATVDLSGENLKAGSQGWRHITDAPMVGVQSTMELIGWDAFYGNPVTLDPLTVHFREQTATLAGTPTITVSETEGLVAGDQITVWGSGFDPAAHVGTRPPLAGQPSGNYVIFGKFADTWRPSQGAASSTRTVISQRWAITEAARQLVDPAHTNDQYTELTAAGTFKAVLTVGESTATGNYGVYTYPGSGATNAAHEVAALVQVNEAVLAE